MGRENKVLAGDVPFGVAQGELDVAVSIVLASVTSPVVEPLSDAFDGQSVFDGAADPSPLAG